MRCMLAGEPNLQPLPQRLICSQPLKPSDTLRLLLQGDLRLLLTTPPACLNSPTHCVCVYVCVCVCIIVHTHTHTHTHTLTHSLTHTTNIHTHTHTHTHTRTHIHMHTHTRIYTHTHIHTHTACSEGQGHRAMLCKHQQRACAKPPPPTLAQNLFREYKAFWLHQ